MYFISTKLTTLSTYWMIKKWFLISLNIFEINVELLRLLTKFLMHSNVSSINFKIVRKLTQKEN